MHAPLDEQTRMHYLEAMGIEQYVPRHELSNSLPSMLLYAIEFPGKAVKSLDKPVNEKTTPAHSSAGHPVEGYLANVLEDTASAEKQNTESKTASNAKPVSENPLSEEFIAETDAQIEKAEKTLRSLSEFLNAPKKEAIQFSLSIWRLNNNMLVLDSRRPKQAMPTTALLGRILEYYGLRTETTEPEIIQWPMDGVNVASVGQDAEKAMVKAFLESRLASSPVDGLWLMGEAAYTNVAIAEADDKSLPYSEVVGASVNLTEQKIPCVVLPSLFDMLIEPLDKRTAWLALNRFLNHGQPA